MVAAVYNEIEPYAADWLVNLERAGHIAPGRVERRSIVDLQPADVAGPGQRHFFAGIGVWSYALRLAGWPDDMPAWTGSCPCQPFSHAGQAGAGLDDRRHLWPAWFRLIRECRPAVVFGEQVANTAGLGWFDAVRADLEGAGYAVGGANFAAAGVGAPHIRQRLYFAAVRLGDAGRDRDREHSRELPGDEAQHALGAAYGGDAPVAAGAARDPWLECDWLECTDGRARPVEPGTFPLAHGPATRVAQLRAYGNAIVAQQAAAFIGAMRDVLAL